MGGIRRYARLYAHFLRFSFSQAAEFRFDFMFRIGMDFLYYGAHLAFFSILFGHSASIGGWNQDQMNIFLGTLFVVDALNMTLFTNNLWVMPLKINRGDFDYYLLRPVSALFMISLREVAINSFINLIGAIAILAYFIARAPFDFGLAKIVVYIFFVLGGLTMSYCLRMLFILPVFWTQAPRGFEGLYFGLSQTAERPDRIYSGWPRRIFTTALPFALIYSYPARTLLDKWSWPIALHAVGMTALFALIVRLVWWRAMTTYSSASS